MKKKFLVGLLLASSALALSPQAYGCALGCAAI
jgi:hypothetical protein